MSQAPRKKIRIGDLLVENKIISENQLMSALAEQKKSGHKLGRALMELGYVTEEQMLDFLSRQLQIPYIDLKHYKYDTETVKKIPETLSRRYRAIALVEESNAFRIGMADPTDIFAFDELSKLFNKPLRLAVLRESDLLRTIDTVFRKTDEISNLAEELEEELSDTDFNLEDLLDTDDASEAPVVKLLQSIFEDALQMGASDIHIEPDEHVLRIRQRIDGMLHEQEMKEKRIVNALVSRLKLMSGLNISERRLPQDGRFNIRIKGRSIDVRLSTMPIQYGESVVMRLLDQSSGKLDLNKVGMPADILQRFRTIIKKPHGMVLVTGPTGSGKTTTLYGALSELNHPEKKIITVEDPVEYRLPRVNQVQVNTKVGLTFSKVLRTALRQDPDIVLIGEMRDQETAEIGLRASITGHLVLSTLHTNDAISTAIRLIDMGIQGYMVATALEAIIAQRLIRKICDGCMIDHQPDVHEASWLKELLGDSAESIQFKRGEGCPHCNNTGYHGRIGVFELLELNEVMADALRRSDSAEFSQLARNHPDFRSLGENALDYAKQGITTLEEVIRVAGENELLETREDEFPVQGESSQNIEGDSV
ncbi:MAG: GspE/PulE family protein [Chromatiales bacterium]|nr:GspE/PulE family protein [Chromatiales bacterium]